LGKYSGKELGVYKTIEEAFAIYSNKKEEIIKQIADEYKNVIPDKVYNALYEYKVSIHNDKNYTTKKQ